MQDSLYDLEVDRVIATVREKKAKKVCLQFPDGLKPLSKDFADIIARETGASVVIWAGSNFGACDLPLEVSRVGVDLLVHFGHSEWVYDCEPVR